ncbi:MAG TPA: beta-ketoacyl-ACP synthase III [Acidimicrobiia bacterium]
MSGVGITGWAAVAPNARLTNADLEARVDTTDAWIVERTGIHERRVAGPDESTASLATAAAAEAIKRAGLTPHDIDLMIIATVTPETLIPHTGAHVGERLGLRCGSFDLNAACSGFVYASVVASSLLRGGLRHVLVVGAETLSRIIDPDDRSTCILFGDGAGAAVWSRADDGSDALLGWDLGCDGSAAELLIIPAGGSARPASPETVAAGDHYLKMQGQEVFKRAVRAVVESARITLERSGMRADDVRWFVPHQANGRIIVNAAQRLGFGEDRVISNLDRFGNTSSASIPLALFEAVDDGRVHDGDLILLSGFGAGMTWASALIRWDTARHTT